MSQKGYLLIFLGWELQGGALVSEVEDLVEEENMVPSFQILQPTSDPPGAAFSPSPPPVAFHRPCAMNVPISWGTGHSSVIQ